MFCSSVALWLFWGFVTISRKTNKLKPGNIPRKMASDESLQGPGKKILSFKIKYDCLGTKISWKMF